MFGLLRKGASAVAGAMVTEDKLSQQVAGQLMEKVPAATAEMGIKLDFVPRFQKGSFIVVRVEVKEVDTRKLLTAAKGDEFAAKFMELLGLLDYFELADAKATAQAKIDEKVQAALMDKLTTVLPQKLAAEGVVVQVSAKSQADQAEFFFSFLDSVDKKA